MLLNRFPAEIHFRKFLFPKVSMNSREKLTAPVSHPRRGSTRTTLRYIEAAPTDGNPYFPYLKPEQILRVCARGARITLLKTLTSSFINRNRCVFAARCPHEYLQKSELRLDGECGGDALVE